MKVASDSNHWYLKDGETFYEVLSAKGELRNATLADARKCGAVPSVTNILGLVAKPQLTRYFQEQMLDAALLVKREPNESEDEYKGRIWQAADLHSKERREEGTKIHGLIDKGFMEGDENIYYLGVREVIDELFPNRMWIPEASFAHSFGFGGKADLSSDTDLDGNDCRPVVIDYKTKEWCDGDKAKRFIYDDHSMQLSAYGLGLLNDTNPIRVNIFVRPSDGKCIYYIHPEDDKALDKFLAILDLWKLIKNYDPSWEV